VRGTGRYNRAEEGKEDTSMQRYRKRPSSRRRRTAGRPSRDYEYDDYDYEDEVAYPVRRKKQSPVPYIAGGAGFLLLIIVIVAASGGGGGGGRRKKKNAYDERWVMQRKREADELSREAGRMLCQAKRIDHEQGKRAAHYYYQKAIDLWHQAERIYKEIEQKTGRTFPGELKSISEGLYEAQKSIGTGE